ncbi:MAG: alpha/beta fold hydrolase [Myxococcota bacterium]
MRLDRVLGGHAWTVLADAKHRLRPISPPPSETWALQVPDGHGGTVRLGGRWSPHPGSRTAVLLVHGLGGSSQSGYCIALADAAARRGWSSLRIDLRGADGSGEDIYHAGLTADLCAALASPALAGQDAIFVVGVSLGGHVCLRLAHDVGSRIAGVVAVSAPLDLAASCASIDRRRAWLYRQVVLRSLKASYADVVRRHGTGPRVPAPASIAAGIDTIWGWDDEVVVPRHGFDDVAHYHQSMSVGPLLRDLDVPALYVGSPFDPMVPGHAVEPSLRAAGDALRVEMLPRGGHVGLPAPALVPSAPRTLPDQLLAWLDTPR